MLLILEEYFKNYPIKRRIVEGLYNLGISVVDGRFYLGGMEISISEIAKAFRVNRRTVYDTLRFIEATPQVKAVMEKIKPSVDICDVVPLMGHQVITIRTTMGYFSRTLAAVGEIVSRYGCYIREFTAKNYGSNDTFIRIIFFRPIPERVINDLSAIDGVRRVEIASPEPLDGKLLCDICEVKVCPNKLSSGLKEIEE
ncbi:regulator of amino acid metabolism, contains ACT domain protein [Thermogymnomonas acidicola]|uniref:Regulator of amino acid metabolism, contains ACT domain protein n=1 Tax=Thermogymnomonas acidicola TaxID=399579 RepID=A0AA37F8Q3_9ARCH|nr:regulator [Thermogymnomonas acidicola]GGM67465.1 regulator of amino acid metabolism, contains ACT domain protein [Thermogymnomonas acidicola]